MQLKWIPKRQTAGIEYLFISEDVFFLFPYVFFYPFLMSWCGWSSRNNKSNRIITNGKQRFLFVFVTYAVGTRTTTSSSSLSTLTEQLAIPPRWAVILPPHGSAPHSPRGLKTSPSPLMDVAWLNPSQVLPSELASTQTLLLFLLLLATSSNFGAE